MLHGEPFTVDKEYLEWVLSDLFSDQYGVPVEIKLVPKEEKPDTALKRG